MTKPRHISALVALIGIAVIGALFVFNRTSFDYDHYIVGNLIGLFWVPMLSILIIGEQPEKFGMAKAASGGIWAICGLLFLLLLVMMFVVGRQESFQAYYPIFRRFSDFADIFARYPRENPFVAAPMAMLFAEASYGLYMFCWEFFFRGYLLFGLARSIGWWAIVVQAIGFGFLHFGKPMPEVLASFGAGIILGIIAMRAKSFVPCFVLHFLASVSFDLIVVLNRSS